MYIRNVEILPLTAEMYLFN